MKNSEFIALLTANTNKTDRVRTYSKHWLTGARRINDEVLFVVGRLVSLIVTRLKEGAIKGCTSNEYLLLYNFQPFQEHDGEQYCTLDALVRPLYSINETHLLEGKPIQFVVNLSTSEVMNNTMGMLKNDLLCLEDIEEDSEGEAPQSYGFFNDFLTIGSFLCIDSNDPINLTNVFYGRYNNSDMFNEKRVYDSSIEAREDMKVKDLEYQYVAELNFPKEQIVSHLQKGLSTFIEKVINMKDHTITVNDNPRVDKEAVVEDETKRIEDGFHESAVVDDEVWKISSSEDFPLEDGLQRCKISSPSNVKRP